MRRFLRVINFYGLLLLQKNKKKMMKKLNYRAS